MSLAGLAAVLYPLFVWWFSTGLVMWVVGLPRFTHPWSLAFATLVGLAGLFGLAAASVDASVGGAYHAFTCAVLVWAWAETGFLMGLVTGPRRVPLTPGAAGAARFSEAVGAVLHHELALLVCGAAVVAVSYGGANPTGLWTFAVLWIMRLSAKLNLFLGVPNRGEAFLPERLRYLASYFADRPINALLPVSITGATAAALLLALQVLDPATLPGAATGLTLVTALLALAIVEHWFMILPVPVVALWGWGLSSRTQGAADAPRLPEPQPRRGLRLPTRPMPRLAVVPAGAIHEQAVPNHRRGT